jgi:hypothetical protein
MTSETLKRYNLRWPDVKVFSTFIYSSQNGLVLILLKVSLKEMFQEIFQSISIQQERSPVCGGIFVYSKPSEGLYKS